MEIHTAALADLDGITLYALLRLRTDVFIVEQHCAYPELDGRDTEPGNRHCWITDDDGAVIACLRMLVDPDGVARIGRVATATSARGRGLAARLMQHALSLVDGPVRLDAQSHLADFYERFGFRRDGEDFLEDGIPHTPMRLDR